MELVALKAFRYPAYGHRMLKPGDRFDAKDRDAHVLVLSRRAARAASTGAADPVKRGPGRPRKVVSEAPAAEPLVASDVPPDPRPPEPPEPPPQPVPHPPHRPEEPPAPEEPENPAA